MKAYQTVFRRSILFLIPALALTVNACFNLEPGLGQINGHWVRVESDSAQFNCLSIDITGDHAIVENNPQAIPGLSLGDSLWTDIVNFDNTDQFSLNIRHSDGLLYEAEIRYQEPDNILLTIASLDNLEERWVRPNLDPRLPECQVPSLHGVWTLQESNEPELERTQISVSQGKARISFLTLWGQNAGLNDDELMWDKLEFIPGGDQFGLEVLHLDRNYYEATINRLDTDRLELLYEVNSITIRQVWER
ncbi:MAG: hypothetical protein AAFQ87_01120 [Bacteroidota bacterium]